VIHRARRPFRHNHFHGFSALFDFLGDKVFFNRGGSGEARPSDRLEFLRLYAQPDVAETPSWPSAPITDFNPLCPPAEPRSRTRIMPQGSAISSQITITSEGLALVRPTSSRTRQAAQVHHRLRLGEHHFVPRDFSTAHIGFRLGPRHPNTGQFGQLIHNQKQPALSGVQANSMPGLPRPTIRRIGLRQALLLDSG